MDVLAHSLWTNFMYKVIPQTKNNKKQTWWGIFFGVFPDLFAFTPIFVVLVYKSIFEHQNFFTDRSNLETNSLSSFTEHMYSYSHSFVIWIVVGLVVWGLFRKFPWFLMGWGLHIAIDLFSHSKEFYPTPFLYPISHYEVNGIPWSHPVFMIINYALLLVVYFLIIPRIKKSALHGHSQS